MKKMLSLLLFVFGCSGTKIVEHSTRIQHDDFVHNRCMEMRSEIESYRQYCNSGSNVELCFTIQEYDKKCQGHINERN